MKVISKSTVEFFIELDENHHVSYDLLEEFFEIHTLVEVVDRIYLSSEYVSSCDKIFKYFFDNNTMGRVMSDMIHYEILDPNILPELIEMEKLYKDVRDNYKVYKREHTIDSLI
tara:strand:+ start:598 stop:939 length:342 start_codon:yes stop_codon:yes gene_type:complete